MLTIEEFKKRLKELKLGLVKKIAPTRENITLEVNNQAIAGGGIHTFYKKDFNEYSALILTLLVTYYTAATDAVRVRWMYSQDDTTYDSASDAIDAGNYEDLTLEAGEQKQRTILITLLTPYLKIQLINLDKTHYVGFDRCYTLSFR